ncbi:hypothetical protein D4R75_06180 [bacterium]|nr:MAG: hypothetical protein D4R75_06180 [bacterium]
MNHKKIQKKILLYLDGDLLGNEKDEMQEHLRSCSFCSKRLEALSRVWRSRNAMELVKPSPYLWTRLAERIKQYECNCHLFTDMSERLGSLVRPAAFVLLFLIALVVGNYLGDFSSSTASVDSEKAAKEEVARMFYMDAFEPYPPESIGKALTIASNGKGGEQLR